MYRVGVVGWFVTSLVVSTLIQQREETVSPWVLGVVGRDDADGEGGRRAACGREGYRR